MITVCEFARLTTLDCVSSLDAAQVPPSAFTWLCELQSRMSPGGVQLLEVEGQTWLRLNSLVGVIQTPCGTTIEILPKTFTNANEASHSRKLLRKMVAALLDLPAKEAAPTALQTFDMPLTEWVMAKFVQCLQALLQQGLRSDYIRVEEEQAFLRGQLNTTAQMRQPAGRAHVFHIRHDVFSPDQAPNRLLKLALERVRKATKHSETWRLTSELAHRLHDIPVSRNTTQDWREWGDGRLLARYRQVRPWCALVLGEEMPLALRGQTHGLSLLFPMEKLFENYVARALGKQLRSGYVLQTQIRSQWLAQQGARHHFLLKPDLMVRHASSGRAWVLDTKWKRLLASEPDKNYGIAQSDMYQMLAYGMTYLKGQGQILLIYPAWADFKSALPAFHLSPNLEVLAVPFNVERDVLDVDRKVDFLIKSVKLPTAA